MFAASQIYSMLKSHKGKVTVKIDGIAASAASVVAMAGDETLIAPTALMMIHDPSTSAMGNKADMEKAIELLEEVKQKIRMLDAIEERLLRARDLVMKSTEVEVLDGQRQDLQREVDGLMAEVQLLEMDDTVNQ